MDAGDAGRPLETREGDQQFRDPGLVDLHFQVEATGPPFVPLFHVPPLGLVPLFAQLFIGVEADLGDRPDGGIGLAAAPSSPPHATLALPLFDHVFHAAGHHFAHRSGSARSSSSATAGVLGSRLGLAVGPVATTELNHPHLGNRGIKLRCGVAIEVVDDLDQRLGQPQIFLGLLDVLRRGGRCGRARQALGGRNGEIGQGE